MSKSKKQTSELSELAKTNKPKALSDRLKHYAEHFRTLPDSLCPRTQFEGETDWQKVPYKPTEFWLKNAGGYVHRVLRIGGFKEFENKLFSVFNKGGEIPLWQELVTILRARANLPYTRDYLATFKEDCQLVTDALKKEAEAVAGVDMGADRYVTLDVATRKITIGTNLFTIKSERIWDFIRELVTAAKSDRLVPRFVGSQDNKNNFDSLRNKVGGPDNLEKLVISIRRGGYKLSPDVKLLNSSQVDIRRTYQKRL